MAKTATKPAKKTTKKAPKASASAGRPKREGIRRPQARILLALKPGRSLDRNTIAEKAGVDVATLVEYIGSHDPAKRKANDAKHFKSLVSYGYVKAEDYGDGNGIVYTITASGKAALEKFQAAEKAKK